ncbi:MAG: hypothetical protein ACRCY3_15615 [Sphingorhabdus sp.]
MMKSFTQAWRKALLPLMCAGLVSGCGADTSSQSSLVTVAEQTAKAETAVAAAALTATDLKNAAKAFPAMPINSAALGRLTGKTPTFSSGLPFNDLEYTIFDTDYIDGETNGYDTFMPVDPSRTVPGADTIKLVTTNLNVDIDSSYSGQRGDRIILGMAGISSPFFAKGSDGVDNDYAVITTFDYTNGLIQLKGASADYGLVRCTTADGCVTDGYYLFHTATGSADLIAFIFPCDVLPDAVGGAGAQTGTQMCNSNKTLSLTNTAQFKYASAISTTATLTNSKQFGTKGNEIVGGVAHDYTGATYVYGSTDGSLSGTTYEGNEVFVRKYNADKTLAWTREVKLSDGSLLWDAVADSSYIYVAGRTLGALSGYTNAGKWDAIILKISLSDGTVAASHQWGGAQLDGYGNITLDDAGNLYVSGAGSATDSGTDADYLVAKHRTSDLGNIWRKIVQPNVTVNGNITVTEGWGGLTYIKSSTAGAGKLVTGGWFMEVESTGGHSNGFLEVWNNLNTTSPARVNSAVIESSGRQADWVLDTIADSSGNIYAVGYTTGSLQGTHKGLGDAYIVKFNGNLGNPVYKQLGTSSSDAFRRIDIDSSGNLYALGYTYGNYSGNNKDSTKKTGDVFVQKLASDLSLTAAFQFGTVGEDRGYLTLRNSTLHVAGMTEGSLGAASTGAFDGYFVRLATSNFAVQ